MKDQIQSVISEVLADLGVEPVDFVVEHPGELAHGDYASNVALVAAKQVGKAPRDLAAQLLVALEGKLPEVEKVEVAGPGFLNFYLRRDFFREKITTILEEGEQWGRNDTWKEKLVMIEYTSPNLFKPLHIGNLVGNIVGESLSRLFELAGANVKRFNYPSDIGMSVAKAVWGMQKTGGDPSDIQALGEAYRTGNAAFEEGGAEKDEIVAINKALYAGSDETLNTLREQGIATSKRRLQELLDVLDTSFDHELPESLVSGPGQALVEEHTGAVFEQSDGAVVYKGEKIGLHTRVFLNSEGLPTYEAKDIGHFKLKHEAEPSWDASVIVTGIEQAEYFKVIFAAIKEVFPDLSERQLEHVATGFLTLTTGKMSSRKGNVLTGESLLEEMQEAARERASETRTDNLDELAEQVAVAALKYQILKHNVGSNIVFDKEKALSFEGDSGPYLQYTHARIISVLEKAAQAGVDASTQLAPPQPYEIEKLLYRFPEVIEEALNERAPHNVTGFLTELAGAFNTFYAQEKIADATDKFAPYKAAVAGAVQQTLQNGLWALGIKAPDKM
ncbi:MAG: arginine--tRNA ligase [Patescibacteria group bacterium]